MKGKNYMNNIKVYGNDECPMCTMLKKDFVKKNIEFEYIDVLQNMKNLKEFLNFRDNNSLFDECKEDNKIGIPLVVMEKDGETKLFTEKYKVDFI